MNRRSLLTGLCLLPAAVALGEIARRRDAAPIGHITTVIKVDDDKWLVMNPPAYKFHNCPHTSYRCDCRYTDYERVA